MLHMSSIGGYRSGRQSRGTNLGHRSQYGLTKGVSSSTCTRQNPAAQEDELELCGWNVRCLQHEMACLRAQERVRRSWDSRTMSETLHVSLIQISGVSTGTSFFSAQSQRSKSFCNMCCSAICTCSSFRSSVQRSEKSSSLSSFLCSLSNCFFFTCTDFSMRSNAFRSSADVSIIKLPCGPARRWKKTSCSESPTIVGSNATMFTGSTGSPFEGGASCSLNSSMSSTTGAVAPSGDLEQQRKMRDGTI